jgi:hypothetical protein
MVPPESCAQESRASRGLFFSLEGIRWKAYAISRLYNFLSQHQRLILEFDWYTVPETWLKNSQVDTQSVSFNHLDTRWTSSMYYRGTIGSAIFQVSPICMISVQIISIQIAILIAHFLWLKNLSQPLNCWLKLSSFHLLSVADWFPSEILL